MIAKISILSIIFFRFFNHSQNADKLYFLYNKCNKIQRIGKQSVWQMQYPHLFPTKKTQGIHFHKTNYLYFRLLVKDLYEMRLSQSIAHWTIFVFFIKLTIFYFL